MTKPIQIMKDEVFPLMDDLSFSDLVEVTWGILKTEYKVRPVTITEFIQSDEYLGSFFNARLNNMFYPYWLKRLKEIYPSEFHSPYFELIRELPIRSGKSLTATCIILYEIYKLQCLKEPRAMYSLAPGTRIVFSIFSASLSLASDVNWEYFEKILKSSKYFLKNCPLPENGRKVSYNSIIFPGNIAIDLGSQSSHAIGKAVFGAMLDEANFQRVASGQAKTNYLALKRRRESRFISVGGDVAGKLILLSSPKLATDFLEEQKTASRSISTTQIIENTPIWDIRRGSQKDVYSGETFPLFVGSSTRDAFILEKGKEYDLTALDSDLVRDIPVEYYDSFVSDTVSSLQDIYGLSSSRASNFINSPEKIETACVMQNRILKDIIEIDFYDEDAKLADYLDKEYFKRIPFRECYRFIHVDLAYSNDRAAISSVFTRTDDDEIGKTNSDSILEGKVYSTNRMYYTDFTMFIEAKQGQEIPLYKITDFIMYLKKTGFPILKVSADQFQSVDLLQRLKVSGFETETISVDRTKIPYLSTKQLIYRGKLLMPNVPLLKKEFLGLLDDGEKIDHPTSGSKDGSDSVVGAVWSAINSKTIQTASGLFKDAVSGGKKDSKLESMFLSMTRNKGLEGLFGNRGL